MHERRSIIPSQNLLPAYPRMCRVAQNVCYADSDCTAVPGDSCGPPTSRAVIAKRGLGNATVQLDVV